jgi:hypothetical protein
VAPVLGWRAALKKQADPLEGIKKEIQTVSQALPA